MPLPPTQYVVWVLFVGLQLQVYVVSGTGPGLLEGGTGGEREGEGGEGREEPRVTFLSPGRRLKFLRGLISWRDLSFGQFCSFLSFLRRQPAARALSWRRCCAVANVVLPAGSVVATLLPSLSFTAPFSLCSEEQIGPTFIFSKTNVVRDLQKPQVTYTHTNTFVSNPPHCDVCNLKLASLIPSFAKLQGFSLSGVIHPSSPARVFCTQQRQQHWCK